LFDISTKHGATVKNSKKHRKAPYGLFQYKKEFVIEGGIGKRKIRRKGCVGRLRGLGINTLLGMWRYVYFPLTSKLLQLSPESAT